jgi:hypothetical protein
VVRGLTNKAQLLFLLFNFIKKPGSGSGRTKFYFPTIGNTCSLYASPDKPSINLKTEFAAPISLTIFVHLLYIFSSSVFYSASVSGDNKRRLKKWFDQSQAGTLHSTHCQRYFDTVFISQLLSGWTHTFNSLVFNADTHFMAATHQSQS